MGIAKTVVVMIPPIALKIMLEKIGEPVAKPRKRVIRSLQVPAKTA